MCIGLIAVGQKEDAIVEIRKIITTRETIFFEIGVAAP